MKIETQIRLNSYLSIIFGILISTGETFRRYGDFGHWSRWMDDYIIGILLIVPAVFVLKGNHSGIILLIAGWGFAAGLLYGSFFSKVLDVKNIGQSNIESGLLIQLIGLAFFTSVFALIWTVIIEIKRCNSHSRNN